MIKRMIMQFSIALFLIMSQSALAGASGLLFNVSATGTPANVSITLCLNGKGALSCQTYNVSALTLSIRTVVPNHVYPAAGIKINTLGYELANLGLSCTPNDNGYCLFSVSNTVPASISLSKTSGYSISGTISNLTESGLVLQNNGADNLTVNSGATSFQFATQVAYGGSYNVTVAQQPTGLTCTVSNGSGTNVIADVENISITCSVDTYTIAGSIANLTATGLVLQNNGADNLIVNSGATLFQFATQVAYGGSYNVTVAQQPTGLTCMVSNGSGVNVIADVENISITCSLLCTGFQFIDISSTGAFVVNGDDVTAIVTLPVGHPISLFGSSYSQLLVSTNGFITSYLSNSAASCQPSPLPTIRISGDVLIPLWSDLFLQGTSSGIYYQYFNICPRSSGLIVNEGCHVFEWYNVSYCCNISPSFNFEVIVYDQSNLAAYQYGPGNPNFHQTATGDQNNTKTLFYEVSPSIIPDNSLFCVNTQSGEFF